MNQQEGESSNGSPVVAARESESEDALAQLSATATKQKLEKLMTDFSTFDDVMRIGTRVRRPGGTRTP
jgi:hypothetical protein